MNMGVDACGGGVMSTSGARYAHMGCATGSSPVSTVRKDDWRTHLADCYLLEAGRWGGGAQTNDYAAGGSIGMSGCIGRQRLQQRRAADSRHSAILLVHHDCQASLGVATGAVAEQ